MELILPGPQLTAVHTVTGSAKSDQPDTNGFSHNGNLLCKYSRDPAKNRPQAQIQKSKGNLCQTYYSTIAATAQEDTRIS